MRGLKPRRLNPKQERLLERCERLMARAQILRAGVKESLKIDYPGPYDLEISIEVLQEAANLEKDARSSRAAIQRPGKAKR